MSRVSILDEVSKERDYQDAKFGGAVVDDRENGPNDWVTYITKYSSQWFPGGFPPYSEAAEEAFRTSMIKTAALAVAAVEQIDRKKGHTETA